MGLTNDSRNFRGAYEEVDITRASMGEKGMVALGEHHKGHAIGKEPLVHFVGGLIEIPTHNGSGEVLPEKTEDRMKEQVSRAPAG